MKRYYITNSLSDAGFEEITETEWRDLIGEAPYRQYAKKLYRGLITTNDIPEEYRERVEEIVNNKILKWGLYSEQKWVDEKNR